MKKTYYKVKAKGLDNWWIVDEVELKNGIAEWITESGSLTITKKMMTEAEYNKLGEWSA
jgi:starvation-inducible outer membrane lipoprotein